MSEKYSSPDAAGVRALEGKSREGKPFQVKAQVNLGDHEEPPIDETGVAVEWPVSDSKEWKDAGAAKSRHIVLYRLRKNPPGETYAYKLEFINDGGWSINFMDSSPDTYTVSTFTNGLHSVNFNSADPTIKWVN